MRQNIFITFIFVLAFLLRFINISSLPALNADEAAIGYNAYSLLQTGQDEHGNSWPVHFQSFNDFKPGLYFYIVLPFIKFLGITEMAVRLPSVFFGTLTVFVVYLLVRERFSKEKNLPEISALFLAISPWHIHFSRGGWEANVATLFITSGIYFFLKSARAQKYILLSGILFVASLYTYHSARVVTPLIVICLVLINRKLIFKNLKKIALYAFTCSLLLIPLILDLAKPGLMARASGVGLFSDLGPIWRANEQRGEHDDYQSFTAKLLHNRPVNYTLSFLNNYAKHFSGEFLFISGDSVQRSKVPETGVVYLPDLLFILSGLIFIAKKPRSWGLIILWLGISPLASAFTFQSPSALRALNMVIPLTIISAYGALGLYGWLLRVRYKLLCYCIIALFLAVSFWSVTRYLHQYYFHMAKTYDYSSNYAAKELVSYIKENYNSYSKFIVTQKYDQPYIFFLFYSKYEPKLFIPNHALSSRDEYGFSTVPEFDKYIFLKNISVREVLANHQQGLVAVSPDEMDDLGEGKEVVKTIYFPSGRPAYILIKGR